MADDIETLKKIKKEEERSEARLKKAENDATKIMEDAKAEAQRIMEGAMKEADGLRNSALAKAKKDSGLRRQQIVFDAKKKASGIKPAGKDIAFKIFQKAIKERFGV